ncbi:MAG: ABC transporter permease subunit, partial [Chloroflexota bacterium]
MRNALAIGGKEVRTYFSSPMAYVVAAIFLAATGFFFVQDLAVLQLARLQGFFGPASFLLLLLCPLLTMRLLAEEQKLGSLELLLTAPVRDEEVVVGKYIGALAMVGAMLALTLYFPLVLFLFGDPDHGPVLTGYLGIFLLGACFAAVGLFASSMTSNQIVAAVIALGFSLLFWLAGTAGSMVQEVPGARDLLQYLMLSTHYGELVRGVV